MNMHPHDPLSPEEHALAERLRRLGGANGPSAALDARILAAAREAAPAPAPGPGPAPVRQRRWLAWSAVPGGAITAMGTAAAFVLVVGLVWQLRPGERPMPESEAANADDGFVSVQMIERPAPAEAAEAAAVAPPQETAPRAARTAAPVRARKQAPARAVEPHAEAGDSAPQAIASLPAPAPPPPPPPPPAAAPDARAVATDTVAAPAAAIERIEAPEPTAEASPAPARRRATYTSSARARPDARSSAARALRPASAETSTQDPVDFGPPSVDAELAPADWLQRIRDRRDNGDADGATESLRRFREAHPHIPVPDDLRALVE